MRLLLLLQDFCKIFATFSESSSIQTAEPIVKCHTILEMGSHDLSPHTLGYGLKDLGNSKACGNDQIEARFLKLAAVSLIQPIMFIINQSIESASFPNQWKIAKVIPLYKGKGNCPFDPLSYRPISILPVLSKIAERAVQSQMLSYLETTNQINRNHHAYRHHHSTTTAMIQLIDRIYTATDRKMITTLLTIDESSAFDCVSYTILLEKMKLYKFSPETIKWMSSYLHGRSQFVSINGKHSKITTVHTGVPQGSVLGPLLYILYINELPEVVKDHQNCHRIEHEPHRELFGVNCETCGEVPCYADDATVVFSSHSRQKNQQKLTQHLDTLSDFLSTNRLSVNQEKTTINEIMIRQKRAKIRGNSPTLTVTDRAGKLKNISASNYTRLLGGNVCKDLSWTDHLVAGKKAIVPAIRRRLGALHLLRDQLPQSSRLLLCNGLIVSKVYYLIQVWGAAPPTLLKKMQVLLNKSARFVIGGNKRTSSHVLMDKCGWLLIDEMVKYQSLVSLWTILHRKIPRQLEDRLTLDDEMYISTEPPRLMTISHGYRHRAVGCWNQLDDSIRSQLSLPKFKRSVKLWLRANRNTDREPD